MSIQPVSSPARQIPSSLFGVPVTVGKADRRIESPELVAGQSGGPQVWANRREAVVRIPEVATFAVRDGAAVVCRPAPGSHPADIAAYLHATVTALLLAQRGRFALHATSVRIHGLDVAIAGAQGTGKSTSALALGARGHRVLCDDVLPLDPQARQTIHIPTFRPIRVATETAQALDIDVSKADEPGPRAAKLALPCKPAPPSRLDAIVILRRHDGPVAYREVERQAALPCVNAYAYGSELLLPWRSEIFRWAAGVAATVRVLLLYRPVSGWSVPEVASLIEDLAAIETHRRGRMSSPAERQSGLDTRASGKERSTGCVPAVLEDAFWTGPVHQVARGRILLTVPGLARALIQAGGEVRVQAQPTAEPADVRWLRDRPVREAGELLAGRFALRAAAVVIGGSAVALVGYGACGKSIAAAALALRRYGILSDHRLELDVGNGVRAQPTSSDLDLWPVAAGLLGLPLQEGALIRSALAKRAYRFPAAESAPLRLVVALDQESAVGKPRSTRLHGGDAISRLHSATAGRLLIEPLDLRPAHFAWMVQIAQAAEVVRLEVDRDLIDPNQVADAVEEMVV